jgi:hypothetical protein
VLLPERAMEEEAAPSSGTPAAVGHRDRGSGSGGTQGRGREGRCEATAVGRTGRVGASRRRWGRPQTRRVGGARGEGKEIGVGFGVVYICLLHLFLIVGS